ncbi:MAG: Nif3-like dinuclear metal center hexameric protein [Clostridia bacterium]|nr:Nif3-like dinuclear metal center hexameric protein [Clostridia bacterium]
MTVRSFYLALCERYPEENRSSFDFDGLQLCPDENREVKTVLVALDLTRESVDMAIETGCDVLLTHHPILFSGVRTLDPSSNMDAENATRLITHGIAHISLHTRFDGGKGGINDALAKKLGLTCIKPFGIDANDPFPLGRKGELEHEMQPKDFAAFAASVLGCHVLLTDGGNTVKRVAVLGGAAGEFTERFVEEGDCDALLTGEVAHHRKLLVAHARKTLAEAGHYGSEKIFIEAILPVISDVDPAIATAPFFDTAHEICVLA